MTLKRFSLSPFLSKQGASQEPPKSTNERAISPLISGKELSASKAGGYALPSASSSDGRWAGLSATLLGMLMLLLGASGCQSHPQRSFEIKGQVLDGADTTLYLTEVLETLRIVDSVRTDSKGYFSLIYPIQQDSILYRLGRGKQGVVFRADSAQQIRLSFRLAQPAGSCHIEGGASNQALMRIQQATQKVEDSIERITELCRRGEMTLAEGNEQIGKLVEAHKQRLSEQYVYPNPSSLEAYFVLLQNLNGGQELYPIDFFAPATIDLHSFGSVASAYEVFKPEHPYTKGLKNKALQLIKIDKQRKGVPYEALLEQAEERAFPALTLIDNQGEEQSLEQVANAHPRVLIAFVSFAMEGMPNFIAELNQLYVHQSAPRTEVYMVSYDRDIDQWMQATRRLPWLNVYDVQQSSVIPFNVTQLPQVYLLQQGTMRRIANLKEAFR